MSKDPLDFNHSIIPTTTQPPLLPEFEIDPNYACKEDVPYSNLFPVSSEETEINESIPADVEWAISEIVKADEEEDGPSWEEISQRGLSKRAKRFLESNTESNLENKINELNEYANVILNDEIKKVHIINNNNGTASAVMESPDADKAKKWADDAWNSVVEERIRKEVKRVEKHTQRDAEKIDEPDTVPEGYRNFKVYPKFIEDAEKQGIAIPANIQISTLLEKRLSRDGKKLALNDANLATACEKADIEHTGTILIGSLDFYEGEEPEIAVGQLDRNGEISEDLHHPVEAVEIEIDPDLEITDSEGLLEVNKAFYTALLLTNKLHSKRAINKEKDKIEDSLQESRLNRVKTSLGSVAANGAVLTSGALEILPPNIQLVVSALTATGTVGNAIYSLIHKVPYLENLTDEEIIDMMENGVSEDAEKLAKEYPVLDFDLNFPVLDLDLLDE